MEQLLKNLSISVNADLYQKDPGTSELGQRIVRESIIMIDELGLEQFNFKKLAKRLQTTESSVYRYFENKHKLLIYIISWFWSWLEYRLVFSTSNINNTEEKLEKAIEIVVFPVKGFSEINQMNPQSLEHIIINESLKAFLTKEVDEDNKEGFFQAYKSFCLRMSEIVEELNPNYSFPHSLVATTVEGIHLQKYYAMHLPILSDIKGDESAIVEMFLEIILRTLKK